MGFRGVEECGYWTGQDLILIKLDRHECFSVFHHLQKYKQSKQRHSLKLGKKRRESSKRKYYIISPRVIIKAIIYHCNQVLAIRLKSNIPKWRAGGTWRKYNVPQTIFKNALLSEEQRGNCTCSLIFSYLFTQLMALFAVVVLFLQRTKQETVRFIYRHWHNVLPYCWVPTILSHPPKPPLLPLPFFVTAALLDDLFTVW